MTLDDLPSKFLQQLFELLSPLDVCHLERVASVGRRLVLAMPDEYLPKFTRRCVRIHYSSHTLRKEIWLGPKYFTGRPVSEPLTVFEIYSHGHESAGSVSSGLHPGLVLTSITRLFDGDDKRDKKYRIRTSPGTSNAQAAAIFLVRWILRKLEPRWVLLKGIGDEELNQLSAILPPTVTQIELDAGEERFEDLERSVVPALNQAALLSFAADRDLQAVRIKRGSIALNKEFFIQPQLQSLTALSVRCWAPFNIDAFRALPNLSVLHIDMCALNSVHMNEVLMSWFYKRRDFEHLYLGFKDFLSGGQEELWRLVAGNLEWNVYTYSNCSRAMRRLQDYQVIELSSLWDKEKFYELVDTSTPFQRCCMKILP